MPKLKTHKATMKRLKISGAKKKKKLIRKKCNQNHFNAKDSGNETRSKRRRSVIAKSDHKNCESLLPYSL